MFKKNLKALKINNPTLADKLQNISIEKAKENIEVYQAESSDIIISYQGLALDDIYDPIRVAKTNWNMNVSKEPSKYDIVVVYGLGLGYLFKRAYVSCNSRIVLYEPKIDIIRYVLEYVDFSNEISDARVYFTDNKIDALNYLTEKYLSDDNLIFLYPKAYAQLMTNDMAEFTNDIVEVCNLKKMDVNTITLLAKKWAKHSLVNLCRMKNSRPVVWLKDYFKNKTALIVAAGPSLKDNIECIKSNRNKFIIFSVNRAAPILFDNGIEPDFVLFADVAPVKKMIDDYTENLKKCIIIADIRANYLVYKTFDNILAYFSKNDLIAQYLSNATNNSFNLLETAGTAAAQAYYCAKLFGINNIIFAGLDLAFKDDIIYADGKKVKPDKNKQIPVDSSKIYKKNVVQIKDLHGNFINTRDDYALFVRQFSDTFEKDTASKLYNISNFGALIKGMQYTTLNDILADKKELKINLSEMQEKFWANTENNWHIVYQEILQILKNEKNSLEELMLKTSLLLEKELDLLKKMNNEENKEIVENDFKHLSQEFSALLPEIVKDPFLSQYFQSEFVQFVNINNDSIKQGIKTFLNLKNFEIKLLEGIVDICGIWIELLTKKFA